MNPRPIAPRILPFIIVAASLLWLTAPATPGLPDGPCDVLRVVDGDTIVVRYRGTAEKVRLLHVDTPESVHPDPSRNSALGKKASAYTRSRLSGRQVSLAFGPEKRGKYGRLLAYVILDGENFNLELVRSGWSPYYTKYGKSRTLHQEFLTAQQAAKSRGANIWSPGRDAGRPAAPRTIASVRPCHGNVKSRIFHAPACRYYRCKQCTRIFHSREAAINAGFRPCKQCNP